VARISAVKRRNAWRRAIREVGVLFVAFGLGDFACTIFKGKMEVLPVLFLAILLNVAGLLAINYSIETEEEETDQETPQGTPEGAQKKTREAKKEVIGRERFATIRRRLKGAIDQTRADWRR
jgi:hypothetical protein